MRLLCSIGVRTHALPHSRAWRTARNHGVASTAAVQSLMALGRGMLFSFFLHLHLRPCCFFVNPVCIGWCVS
jgi:hypothetical protein